MLQYSRIYEDYAAAWLTVGDVTATNEEWKLLAKGWQCPLLWPVTSVVNVQAGGVIVVPVQEIAFVVKCRSQQSHQYIPMLYAIKCQAPIVLIIIAAKQYMMSCQQI